MKRYLVPTVIFFSVLILAAAVFFAKDAFIVKNVNIEKNFPVNNRKLLEYLGINRNRFIWNYDIGEMETKLSKDKNLAYYKIEKKYPDSIEITLHVRTPLANISGTNGLVFFIDSEGAIFNKYDINYHIPLIIFNKNINLSFNSHNGIADVLNNLNNLKENEKKLYDSITQIEIYEKNDGLSDFIVNYRTINNRIYLKNSINVDLLKKGLVCALYLTECGLNDRDIEYSGAGFVF
jgi:hypothetical protein